MAAEPSPEPGLDDPKSCTDAAAVLPEPQGRPIALPMDGPQATSGAQGRLPPDVIRAKVRAVYPRIKSCYEAGRGRHPHLAGRVTLHFAIGMDGKARDVTVSHNELPDCGAVVRCMVEEFGKVDFPPPQGGIVTVSYPIELAPE